MWLSKQAYQDLRDSLTAAVAVRDSQIATLRATEATMNWLTVRVSQLEHERSILLRDYMGVTVPALTIRRDTPQTEPLDSPVSFSDVGDDEAKRLGIDWNPETGEINYNIKD